MVTQTLSSKLRSNQSEQDLQYENDFEDEREEVSPEDAEPKPHGAHPLSKFDEVKENDSTSKK